MNNFEMNQTPQEWVSELQTLRQCLKDSVLTFHGRCSQFTDKHKDFIIAMEPTERVEYILANLALYQSSLNLPSKKHPENFCIDCQEAEVEELGNHCKKCFPGYKVRWDQDERCEIYITKIASKEKLVEVQKKLTEKLKEFQTINDELLKLQKQQQELTEILGEK